MSSLNGMVATLVHNGTMKFSVKKHCGFTLVELMITLAILAIVVAVGVPGFGSIIDKRTIDGTYQSMLSDFTFARNEARIRGKPVSICQTQVQNLDDATDIDTSSKACTKQKKLWNLGWIIFVDDGAGSGTANDGYRNGDEEVLKVSAPADPNKVKIVFKRSDGSARGERNNILFDADGRTFLINSTVRYNTNYTSIVCIPGKETEHEKNRGFLVAKSGKIEELVDRNSDGKMDIQYVKDNGSRNRRDGNCS